MIFLYCSLAVLTVGVLVSLLLVHYKLDDVKNQNVQLSYFINTIIEQLDQLAKDKCKFVPGVQMCQAIQQERSLFELPQVESKPEVEIEPTLQVPQYEVLENREGQWCHHSYRPENHPDIDIYAKHPRFNVVDPSGQLLREIEG